MVAFAKWKIFFWKPLMLDVEEMIHDFKKIFL